MKTGTSRGVPVFIPDPLQIHFEESNRFLTGDDAVHMRGVMRDGGKTENMRSR